MNLSTDSAAVGKHRVNPEEDKHSLFGSEEEKTIGII
jgi:hypothetical protein